MHAARVAFTATIASLSLSSAAHAQLRLHGLLGDRMVLQRDSDVVLSGKASREAEIVVEPSWGGEPLRASADAAGEWAVAVRTPGAGGPHTIKFSGDGEITLNDVYCGEVW